MFLEESLWIKSILLKFSKNETSPILNIGSSSKEFREIRQPHIYKNVFQPLENRGVKIFHIDIKESEGIDFVGDIGNSFFRENLKKLKPKFIICSNVLEHVPDLEKFCIALKDLAQENCNLIITVPYKYPRHNDPIDNLYRPSTSDLMNKFYEYYEVETKIIKIKNKFKPLNFLKLFFRLLMPFYKFKNWISAIDLFFYSFREKSISCICIRKRI